MIKIIALSSFLICYFCISTPSAVLAQSVSVTENARVNEMLNKHADQIISFEKLCVEGSLSPDVMTSLLNNMLDQEVKSGSITASDRPEAESFLNKLVSRCQLSLELDITLQKAAADFEQGKITAESYKTTYKTALVKLQAVGYITQEQSDRLYAEFLAKINAVANQPATAVNTSGQNTTQQPFLNTLSGPGHLYTTPITTASEPNPIAPSNTTPIQTPKVVQEPSNSTTELDDFAKLRAQTKLPSQYTKYQAGFDEVDDMYQNGEISLKKWKNERHLRILMVRSDWVDENESGNRDRKLREELNQLIDAYAEPRLLPAKSVYDEIIDVTHDAAQEKIDYKTWHSKCEEIYHRALSQNLITQKEHDLLIKELDEVDIEQKIASQKEREKKNEEIEYFKLHTSALHGFILSFMASAGYIPMDTESEGNFLSGMTYTEGDIFPFGGTIMLGYHIPLGSALVHADDCDRMGYCTYKSDIAKFVLGLYLRQDFIGALGLDDREEKYGLQLLGLSSFMTELKMGTGNTEGGIMVNLGVGLGIVYNLYTPDDKAKLYDGAHFSWMLRFGGDYYITDNFMIGLACDFWFLNAINEIRPFYQPEISFTFHFI